MVAPASRCHGRAPHHRQGICHLDVHRRRGRRPDLVVLVDPLLEFDWYRRNPRAVYPSLQIPDLTETSWVEAVVAANQRRGHLCRTAITGVQPLTCAPLSR